MKPLPRVRNKTTRVDEKKLEICALAARTGGAGQAAGAEEKQENETGLILPFHRG